jgi:hypothetical protein
MLSGTDHKKMFVCVYSVFLFTRVARSLVAGRSPIQGVLINLYRLIKILEHGKRKSLDCTGLQPHQEVLLVAVAAAVLVVTAVAVAVAVVVVVVPSISKKFYGNVCSHL